MALIFVGSSDTLSFQHTSRFLGPFLRWLMPDITPLGLHHAMIVVRKMGHMCEYAILFLLLFHALRATLRGDDLQWRWSDAGASLLLVMAYAASDEFHQRFVRTREASIRDVLIDSAGAVVALGVLWLVRRRRAQP